MIGPLPPSLIGPILPCLGERALPLLPASSAHLPPRPGWPSLCPRLPSHPPAPLSHCPWSTWDVQGLKLPQADLGESLSAFHGSLFTQNIGRTAAYLQKRMRALGFYLCQILSKQVQVARVREKNN